jgi:hypothetical protein
MGGTLAISFVDIISTTRPSHYFNRPALPPHNKQSCLSTGMLIGKDKSKQ